MALTEDEHRAAIKAAEQRKKMPPSPVGYDLKNGSWVRAKPKGMVEDAYSGVWIDPKTGSQ